MATQVIAAQNSNITYSNSTGQNVRCIVYYLATTSSGNPEVTIGPLTINLPKSSRIGKYVASHNDQGTYGNNHANEGGYNTRFAFPCEFVLADGQSISSVSVTAYNILIIPEGG
tara:strand:- start:160 stop:501 length:342 start_codon:yes stop_codon:yes gene_type:complete